MGIIIAHYKDPYSTTSTMESRRFSWLIMSYGNPTMVVSRFFFWKDLPPMASLLIFKYCAKKTIPPFLVASRMPQNPRNPLVLWLPRTILDPACHFPNVPLAKVSCNNFQYLGILVRSHGHLLQALAFFGTKFTFLESQA